MPHRVADSPFPQERTRQQEEIDFEHNAMAPARPRLSGGGETPGEALTGTPTPAVSASPEWEFLYPEQRADGVYEIYQDQYGNYDARKVDSSPPPNNQLPPPPVNTGNITPQHRDELRNAGYGDWANPSLSEADYQRISLGARTAAGVGGTGTGQFNIAPIDVIDADTRRMYQEYLEARLRDLELPEMRNLDRRQRIQLAFEAALAFGDQSGYTTDPSSFAAFVGVELPGDLEFLAGMPTLDRQRFEEATRQFNIQFAASEEEAQFRRDVTRSEIFGNPRNMTQSLMMLGLTPEQAAQFLKKTSLVRSLSGDRSVLESGLNFPGTAPPSAPGAQPTEGVVTTPGFRTPGTPILDAQGNVVPESSSVGHSGRFVPPVQQQLMWPDATRGLGGIGAQVLTPVNMNDPEEVARYYRQFGGGRQPVSPGSIPYGGFPPPPDSFESMNPWMAPPSAPGDPSRSRSFPGGSPLTGQIPGQPEGVTYETRNPLFPFISGRALPVRQTLSDFETGSQRIPLYESLASFSGQEPSNFFGEFRSFLPKGSTAPLTQVR